MAKKNQNRQGGWKASLARVLAENNGRKATGGSVASYATQDKRADILYSGFNRLRELNFKIKDTAEFKERHLMTLVKDWESKKLSASTIQNSISIFRTFSAWIGKPGMIKAAESYVSTRGAASRSGVTKTDKSWSAKGVDARSLIASVAAKDPRVAIQLELQAAFGLRTKEAVMLKPFLADKGQFLAISWGTKGGRERVVPIVNDYQRDVLNRAGELAASRVRSTADPSKTLSQWKNHFYHVVRESGISRKNGITPHGLRHERLNDIYREITGIDSPVRGGEKTSIPRDLHDAARHEVVEVAGHSACDKAAAYIGS